MKSLDIAKDGVNWLLKGDASKITLGYQKLPEYESGNDFAKKGNNSQVVHNIKFHYTILK